MLASVALLSLSSVSLAADPPAFSLGGRQVRVRPGSVFEPHSLTPPQGPAERHASASAAGGTTLGRDEATESRIVETGGAEATELTELSDLEPPPRDLKFGAWDRFAGRTGDEVEVGNAEIGERRPAEVAQVSGREPALLPPLPPTHAPTPIVIYQPAWPNAGVEANEPRATRLSAADSAILVAVGFGGGLALGVALMAVPVAIALRRPIVLARESRTWASTDDRGQGDLKELSDSQSARLARAREASSSRPADANAHGRGGQSQDAGAESPPTPSLFEAVLQQNLRMHDALRPRDATDRDAEST